MSARSVSSDESGEDLQETFGPLLTIEHASLVNLASRIRRHRDGDHESENSTVTFLTGSYNIVYIICFPDNTRYVIRISAAGWGDRFTETAKEALISQAISMKYITKHTQIPLLTVYEFDSTRNNEIGAPYIAMSYVPGRTVISLWFDEEEDPATLESRRRTILGSVAEAASQLEQLRFDKIGSLRPREDGSIEVGPYFEFDSGQLEDDDYGMKLLVQTCGPFQTTSEYLTSMLDSSRATRRGFSLNVGAEKIIATAISCLPIPQTRRETFALTIPDFDSQNILVDDNGTLTGIIDWDRVGTEPECLGPCRYPSWITRDWDPVMYSYPDNKNEDSPEKLGEYRRFYLEQIEQTRRCQDVEVARKSHIFEAVCIGAGSRLCRLPIAQKLVARTLHHDDEDAISTFIGDVGDGEVGAKEMRHFRESLQGLLSVPWSTRR